MDDFLPVRNMSEEDFLAHCSPRTRERAREEGGSKGLDGRNAKGDGGHGLLGGGGESDARGMSPMREFPGDYRGELIQSWQAVVQNSRKYDKLVADRARKAGSKQQAMTNMRLITKTMSKCKSGTDGSAAAAAAAAGDHAMQKELTTTTMGTNLGSPLTLPLGSGAADINGNFLGGVPSGAAQGSHSHSAVPQSSAGAGGSPVCSPGSSPKYVPPKTPTQLFFAEQKAQFLAEQKARTASQGSRAAAANPRDGKTHT